MVHLQLSRPLKELTTRSREAARIRREAENARWNSALEALRLVLRDHSRQQPDEPVSIGELFDMAKARSIGTMTTVQLAFDRLEQLGEVQYRIGKGVFVFPRIAEGV